MSEETAATSCVGEHLKITFDGLFIFLGLTLSFFACFAGLSSLSYAIAVRKDRRFRFQFISLMTAAGVAVGGCGIWTMHFLGMSAETLTNTCTGEEIPLVYNIPITIVSLVVAIISSAWSMYFVLPVEKSDDRSKGVMTLKDLQKGQKRKKDGPEYWVFPVKINGRLLKVVKINVGRFVASTLALALGALGMHYLGMLAQYGPYTMVFDVGLVTTSVLVAVAVAGVGLFIVVQVSYLGQVNTTGPRAAAALVIALAVNCVHYSGAKAAAHVFTGDDERNNMHGLGPATEVSSLHVGIGSLAFNLLQLMLCQYISEVVYAQQQKLNDALKRKLPKDIMERLQQIYDEVKGNDGGAVADYIPDLAKANPDRFAISVCDMSGEVFSVGDAGVSFSIQSCCKPILYMMALEELGVDVVGSKINTEPSGQPFNALSIDPSNRAYNPFVNAGAMVSAALISEEDGFPRVPEEIYEEFEATCQDMALEPVRCTFDSHVFSSEMATNDNNCSIAQELNKRGIIGLDAGTAVDVYTRCCSMLVCAEDAALMAATMANSGKNPDTYEQVFEPHVVEHAITVMMSCGMYNGAGKWITDVGIPAKSGVAGLVMGVVPGVCGIAVFSPRLDENGNSFRGVQVAKLMSEKFDLHVLKTGKTTDGSPDVLSDLPSQSKKKRRKQRMNGDTSSYTSGASSFTEDSSERGLHSSSRSTGRAAQPRRASNISVSESQMDGQAAAGNSKGAVPAWRSPQSTETGADTAPVVPRIRPPQSSHVVDIMDSARDGPDMRGRTQLTQVESFGSHDSLQLPGSAFGEP